VTEKSKPESPAQDKPKRSLLHRLGSGLKKLVTKVGGKKKDAEKATGHAHPEKIHAARPASTAAKRPPQTREERYGKPPQEGGERRRPERGRGGPPGERERSGPRGERERERGGDRRSGRGGPKRGRDREQRSSAYEEDAGYVRRPQTPPGPPPPPPEVPPGPYPAAFEALGLTPAVLAGIRDLGYENPTEIQSRVAPILLEGRDVIGASQTGTGKTAAFGMPTLCRLGPPGALRCLVLEPTRELAAQVVDNFEKLGKHTGLRTVLVHGGFLPDVRRIVEKTPEKRQTLFFSATMPPQIKSLADWALREPTAVEVGIRFSAAETVSHYLYPVASDQREELILELLRRTDFHSVMIFTRTKMDADRLYAAITRDAQHKVAVMHSDIKQRDREKALLGFRDGTFEVIVATDLAARGLDVSGVTHVINYMVPENPEDYVHRIGRTGRAQKEGDAFTLFSAEELPYVASIERMIGQSIERKKLEDFPYKYTTVLDNEDRARAILFGRGKKKRR